VATHNSLLICHCSWLSLAYCRSLAAGADSVFCCLGTTRGVAGSADQFRKVDRDYVAATAQAAKAAGTPFFALVSAQGARPNVWASDFKPLHGLLYMKTKGQVGLLRCHALERCWKIGTGALAVHPPL
jgi:hypothetical protein